MSVIFLQRVWRIITDNRLHEFRDREKVCRVSEACRPPVMIARLQQANL
jgi:hypothetical protein